MCANSAFASSAAFCASFGRMNTWLEFEAGGKEVRVAVWLPFACCVSEASSYVRASGNQWQLEKHVVCISTNKDRSERRSQKGDQKAGMPARSLELKRTTHFAARCRLDWHKNAEGPPQNQ